MRWLAGECSEQGWTRQTRADLRGGLTGQGLGTGGLEEFVARQGGLRVARKDKGKLMRGGWADSSSGFLSPRLQLLVNAGLAFGRQLVKA